MNIIFAAFGAFSSDQGGYGPIGRITLTPAPVAGVPEYVLQILPKPTVTTPAGVIVSTSQAGS
jgi:hypothetical protein